MKFNLKKQNGMALPLVIIIFIIVVTLTTTTVSAAFFESKHSIIDENQTKAYYLARSAVEMVSKSIELEINDLNDKKTQLDNAISVYNSNLDNATDLTAFNNYTTALSVYNSTLNYIKNNVLPIEGLMPYEHTVDGLENVSSVIVTPISGAYRLEASSTVNGSSARAIMNMDIVTNSVTYTLTLNNTSTVETEIDETTTTIIPGNNPALFADAIYSYGNISLDNNVELIKINNSGASGKYRGNKDGKMKVNKGVVSQDASVDLPLEPKSLLPINIDEDIRYSSLIIQNNFPSTLTAANNGYYKIDPIPQNTDYIVDTSLGNVVIKLNRLEFTGKTTFKVTGSNYFYIYIEDNNLTDGGVVVDGNNKVEFKSVDNQPRTFIIIDQPINDRLVSGNDIHFKNTLTLYGYIYAPYSGLEFKNSPDIFGSIVSGDIIIKNNLLITHIQPSIGSDSGDGSGDQVITITTKKKVSVTTPVSTDTTYPLDVIPVSISKYWMSK